MCGRSIGILGGSFDPVHLGHVNLARDALTQAGLSHVYLVPARLQPFKLDRIPASGADRMEMLRLALADEPRISPCDYELTQEGISYTYLTLRALQARFGADTKLWFITGTDSMLKLSSWKNAEELLTQYAFIVGSRPGYMEDALAAAIGDNRARFGTEILQIENRQFDISATQIRATIAAGEPAGQLIPESVERYIQDHGLYV